MSWFEELAEPLPSGIVKLYLAMERYKEQHPGMSEDFRKIILSWCMRSSKTFEDVRRAAEMHVHVSDVKNHRSGAVL